MDEAQTKVKAWREYFYYDATSATGLRWNTEIRSGVYSIRVMCRPGDVAGSVKSNGRGCQVSLHGVNYFVHRIIWELHHGLLTDDQVIDHKDGNPQNNLLDNLKAMTQIRNMRNQKKSSNNTSGANGVSHMHVKGSDYAVASWRTLEGKFKQRCFSVKKFGLDGAFQQAIACRAEAVEKMNANGAGYSSRHGT